ncbi:MAG: hypothetical protein KDA77_09885 [Planctomycetaceae bacterium]|nr:hypothetical protein [Planctomycetaceae bacterium]
MRYLFPMTLFLILFLVSLLNAADPPSKSYEDLGFDTVKVLEYKKALREQGDKDLRFPPRTGNALIVKMDQYQTQIDSAITVVEDTRASRAKLQDQDLIVVINGKSLRSPDEGDQLLEQITYKDTLELRVIRRTENRWERVTVTLEPLSEQTYYRFKINSEHFRDDDFSGCEFWFHRNSEPRFSQGNFRLYVKQRHNAPPPHLYLEMSLFLPDAPHQKDTTKINGFIIKTDRAEYRVAIEDHVENRKQEYKKQLTEANKLVQSAEKQVKAASDKKEADPVGYSKALNALRSAKSKYQDLQTAETEFLHNVKQKAEQRNQETKKNVKGFYLSLSEDDRKMLDELMDCMNRLEAAPESTLQYLERGRLVRSQVAFSRMLQGWELYDLPLKKSQRKMIEEIISSEKATFWFETVPDKTFEITPAQKKQLKEMLKVFDIEEGRLGD